MPRMGRSRIKATVNWLLFLLVVVSVGVAVLQSRRVTALQQELSRLRAAAELAQPRKEHEELLRLRTQAAELTRLRAENLRLSAEVQRLGAGLSALQGPAAAPPPGPPAEDLAAREARARAESMTCVSYLKQIGLAAHVWAQDHAGIFPSAFLTMSNELRSPISLVCPSDKARVRLTTWSEVNANAVTYQMVSPGMKNNEPEKALVTCPIHGHVCLGDGSVQQGQPPQ
jgi:hypothetical protein